MWSEDSGVLSESVVLVESCPHCGATASGVGMQVTAEVTAGERFRPCLI